MNIAFLLNGLPFVDCLSYALKYIFIIFCMEPTCDVCIFTTPIIYRD